MRKRIGYAVAWLVAAAVAVTVGVVAVSTVGASIRGRGPLGNSVTRTDKLEAQSPSPDPKATKVRDTVQGAYGSFVVECRGVYAYGVAARPAASAGWRVVSYEPGPDDDVDAVFSNGRRSVDLEVFCNRGKPTLAELENKTLPERDD